MVLEIGVGDKLKGKMDASTCKSNMIFAKELEDELMKLATNSDEEDQVERNMDECTNSCRDQPVEAECPDTTESSSSSFDDCEDEVESVDNVGDFGFDVSGFHGDDLSPLDLDGFGELFGTRKRRPTDHWRSFIHPIRWRCKWVELQIQKLEEQARKLDKKINECNQQKQVEVASSSQNRFGSEVLLRRKKRRRNEFREDIASYMSHHNLFSYYEKRNYFTDGASMADEHAKRINEDENFVLDELLHVKTGDDDDILENIFRKIEFLQSKVRDLKSRVDKVSSENSSLPTMTGSPRNSDAPSNSEDGISIGSLIAAQLLEYNFADLLLAENGGLLPDVNGGTNHVYFAGNGDDDVLIDNHRVSEEMQCFEEIKIQPIQRPPLFLKNGSGILSPPIVAGPDRPTDDHRPLKISPGSNISSPQIKNEKGRRKDAS